METRFVDLQETNNPFDGMLVSSGIVLNEVLEWMRCREPSFCELVGDRHKLLIGIGPDYGCAQFSPADGNPPYLVALSDTDNGTDDYRGFLIGNTPTEVPLRFCLHLDIIREIVVEFVKTGNRSRTIEWEEI